MKIYISSDMEGLSGVVLGSSCNHPNADYERYRKFMTQETNAAIEGAFEAGAKEVLVNDGHGSMRNILIEDLNPDARLITGYPKPYLQLKGLDESFEGIIFIGYHARVNTRGVLAHTYTGFAIDELNLNGHLMSEAVFNGTIAGYYGIPVLAISGDDILEDQVKQYFPDTEYAQTKIAVSGRAANCLSPKKAEALIKEKVIIGIENRNRIKPLKIDPPYELKVRLKAPVIADVAEVIPGVERIDDSSVQYYSKDLMEISNMVTTIYNASCVLVHPLYQ